MVNPLRRLAGQTAIYGLSNIVGRVINFLLVPLYTRVFAPGEYGVVTEMYVYVAFLLIVLTYGMETALFRFSEEDQKNKDRVFSTSLLSVLTSSSIFILLVLLFRHTLAQAMRYGDHVEYIVLLAFIVGLDAFSAISYARLRAQNRPWRFAFVRLTGILVNITLVLFFLLLCPWLAEHGSPGVKALVQQIHDPEMGVGYVFIANLVATLWSLALLSPVIFGARPVFDTRLWGKMLLYALPLLVAGMAGWINEALDKLLLKYILPEGIAMQQVGIYGAVYKLSIMMTLFVQAFRFAAEPFYFAQARHPGAKELFSRVMNYFVLIMLLLFLVITLFLDLFKHFIGPAFHEGLPVVPILLMANLFLGIYWNLSIWYKLCGKTIYGAWFALLGALITILLNLWWIPLFGYHGSAWATLVCYFGLALLSLLFGQKHYRIPYDIPYLMAMIAMAIGIHLAASLTDPLPTAWQFLLRLGLLLLFPLLAYLAKPSLLSDYKDIARQGTP